MLKFLTLARLLEHVREFTRNGAMKDLEISEEIINSLGGLYVFEAVNVDPGPYL